MKRCHAVVTFPAAIKPLFEVCSEQEWLRARRRQSHSGNVPLDHADIAAAIEFLSTAKIGTVVRVRCTDALQDRKRGAAVDHASRRELSIRTKYHEGYVLIRLEN